MKLTVTRRGMDTEKVNDSSPLLEGLFDSLEINKKWLDFSVPYLHLSTSSIHSWHSSFNINKVSDLPRVRPYADFS